MIMTRHTTTNTVNTQHCINNKFPTTNISPRMEFRNIVNMSRNNFSISFYRKSYIAWDKLERANKPMEHTDKTKYLGKNSKALLSVVVQKLKKKEKVFFNHKYISTITRCERRQNQNIIKELSNILDIKYHNLVFDNGKKHRFSYEFSLKKEEKDNEVEDCAKEKESHEKNIKNVPSENSSLGQKISRGYIYKENNIIKNRSRFIFEKNYSSKENSNAETNSKIGKGENKSSNNRTITKASTYQIASNDSSSNISSDIKKQPTTNNSNGFLGSGKFLSEMLEDLTEDMCELIRSNSGRNFTNRAIKEIAKAVSRSKKGSKAFFYHIKGFIAYLSKILRFEKRDPEKISGDDYYITANQTQEEQDIKKQEKYLSEIEYSLQVSPEWHLKKKLAAVLERAKAYDVLTSFKSLDIKQNKALITVNKHVELSREERNIILNQIRATHERVDDAGQIQYIEFLEIITSDRSTAPLNSASLPIELDQGFLKREGIWGKVREKFARLAGSEGDAIDKSWTASLKANIDESNNTIDLFAPTPFIRDWINSNYLFQLESIAKDFGYNIDSIRL